jgi:hypothetical protein
MQSQARRLPLLWLTVFAFLTALAGLLFALTVFLALLSRLTLLAALLTTLATALTTTLLTALATLLALLVLFLVIWHWEYSLHGQREQALRLASSTSSAIR